MPTSVPLAIRAFVPPYTLQLDDSEPILIKEAGQAVAMAAFYLQDAPPNTVAVLTDAAGTVWAMKTNDAGELIEVPF